MFIKFQQHLDRNLPFLNAGKLLLAVSGGVDSMVLAHLFEKLDHRISMAHCNFRLRGEESDGDEAFVKAYADARKLAVHTVRFDTALFASENKLSIQVAARRLRYLWFEELMQEYGYDFVLTAHHLDDSLETFLINLSRGTGLEGLTGIPQQNEKVIRPLLPFGREEITAFAQRNNISWREDSSNSSTKYLRNKMRHDVVPVLKSLNPSFDVSFVNTLQHLQHAQSLVSDAAILVYQQVVEEHPDCKAINLDRLLRLPNYKAYLYQWLAPCGFTSWDDIYNLVDAEPGKTVSSARYRLVKGREALLITPLQEQSERQLYEIFEDAETIGIPIPLKISVVDSSDNIRRQNVFFADKDTLKFPLFVRKWQEGDWFCPAGMNGRKKKVSKFLRDEKLSQPEKEKVWVLMSGSDIAWVMGYRADERFTAKNTTNTIVKIELLK